MLSQHILFIVERIIDILNVDNERNQILPLYQKLSHVERNTFEELYWNYYWKKQFLQKKSDEIKEILESYPDDEGKEILKWYFFDLIDEPPIEWSRDYNKDDVSFYDWQQLWKKYERERTLKFNSQVVLSKGVEDGIRELQNKLRRVYSDLRDSQVLSEYDQQYLKLCNLAHSCDDFLDGVMSNHVTVHDIDTLLQKIPNFYSDNPSSTQFNYNVDVQGNINSGDTQNIANSNITIIHTKPSNNNNYSRPKSYGHVPNPDLVGFNHEIQLLLNHLIQSHHETHVVGIVGPGGSGKTTLAKHIYHHPQINSHFTHKVWVCVSQSWDKTTILNSIRRQATQNPEAPEMGYEQLVDCLSELLRSKSYLVIVDDIWSIDAWYDISPALAHNSGSKVVITTRNKFLPQRIDPSVLLVEPKQLNDKECYELFKKRAFLDENVHHELKSLWMKMVKKCKGLPLAVVALAGVLGKDKSLSSWERISKRVTDQMLNMANDSTQGMVKKILALSYHELHENLKPCALYLHVFPEDYVIEAQQLIQMWIAEHFVDKENKAQEYLDDLVQRCIVEVVETDHKGQVHRFRIHDLIREMFINIDKERGIRKRPVLRLAPLHEDGHKDFVSREIGDRNIHGNQHARSFISLNSDVPAILLVDVFIKLKLLRVLIINKKGLWNEFSEEIGKLIHLRYLKLGGETKHFPRSIGYLENLLTLDLRNFHPRRGETTTYLGKLKELRHLYMPLRQTSGWVITVMGLEKLKKLETLWVERGKWMFPVISKLSNALQELSIWSIRNPKEVEEVFRTPSITSNNLHTLVLGWDFCEVGDMSMMSKCKSITKLKLRGPIKEGISLKFPPNLIHLEMTHTLTKEKQVLNMISDSCPLLKFLIFVGIAYYGTEIVCNRNSFPRLEKLELIKHDKVERWIIEKGAMPRLNHLIISDCPLLDLNDQGWKHISKIPKLTVSPPFKKKKNFNNGKRIGFFAISQCVCVFSFCYFIFILQLCLS